jgi:hypothetical protein
MPRMFVRATLAFTLILSSIACTMWGKTAKGWAGETGSENIEGLFWNDVVQKDFSKVDAHVASSFSGSGPSGPMDRAAFLQWLHTGQIKSVALSECSTRLNGADVIIACIAEHAGTTPDRVSTLSVWQEYKKGWLLVAHSETPLARP